MIFFISWPPLRKVSYRFTPEKIVFFKEKTTHNAPNKLPPQKNFNPNPKTNQSEKELPTPQKHKIVLYFMCAPQNEHDQVPKYWHRTPSWLFLLVIALEIRGVKLQYNSYRNKYHVTAFFSLILATSFVNWNAK